MYRCIDGVQLAVDFFGFSNGKGGEKKMKKSSLWNPKAGQKSKGTVWDRIVNSSTNSNTALSILRSGPQAKKGNQRQFENREARRNEIKKLHDMYDKEKKKISKPKKSTHRKPIRKQRPRVESKREYARSLEEQMRAKAASRISETEEEESESIYDLRPATYNSNIVKKEKESYGNFLKAQMEERRQREEREYSYDKEIAPRDVRDEEENSRQIKRVKQQQYAADLQEQIRLRTASRRQDISLQQETAMVAQQQQYIERLSPKSTDRSSKNEYANYLRQQMKEKEERVRREKLEKQQYDEQIERDAQHYYDTIQRRHLGGTGTQQQQQTTSSSTTPSDAIDVLVSGTTTIRPRRRAESSAVEENRRRQMGSTGFLFGGSRCRAESSPVEKNRSRQMGSQGVFGSSPTRVSSVSPTPCVSAVSPTPRVSDNNISHSSVEVNRRRQMGSSGVFGATSPTRVSNNNNNNTNPATSPKSPGNYGHRKLRGVEQEDALMREREKAIEMKRVLDAQIEEKRRRKEREKQLELEREREEMKRIERDRREMESNAKRQESVVGRRQQNRRNSYRADDPEQTDMYQHPVVSVTRQPTPPAPRATATFSQEPTATITQEPRRRLLSSTPPDEKTNYRSRENSEEHVSHLQRQMELQNQLISSLQEQLKMQSNVSDRNAEKLGSLLRDSQKRREREEEERKQAREFNLRESHFRESSTFQPVTPSSNFESPSYRNAKDKYWNRIQSNAKSTYGELDHLAESYTETEYDYGEYDDDNGPITVSGVPII